jgi:uncharacterized repeat protein (TIGR01451 family)
MNFSHLTRITSLVLALSVSAWLVQPAHAQSLAQAPSSSLSSELTAHRVALREDGREALESAQTVKPGDLVQYAVTFKNTTKAPLTNIAATLPIPRGTDFVAATVKPEGAMASVDGVRFEPMPLKRKVQQADGRWIEVAVPLSEYRSLRWPARTLSAGEQFSASLRVRVTDNTTRVASAPAGK